MMHDIFWFFTTGRFDPTWVQAVVTAAVLIVTTVTLGVLIWYACDTHTLATTSIAQISFVREQHQAEIEKGFHVAFDSVHMLQNDLIALLSSFVNHTFGTNRPAAVYPENWPEITSALRQRIPTISSPAIQLGVKLRDIDFAIREFFEASPQNKSACQKKAFEAIENAIDGCKTLTAAMMSAPD
jgi:hypothetical protein